MAKSNPEFEMFRAYMEATPTEFARSLEDIKRDKLAAQALLGQMKELIDLTPPHAPKGTP